MSANTYYINSAIGGIYKTTDANERRRLLRRGWAKIRRDELDRLFGSKAVKALAEQLDGRYLYHSPSRSFVFRPIADN